MTTLDEQVTAWIALPEPERQRYLLAATGLSNSAVAREVGVSPAAVSRWTSGIRRPRGETLIKYSRLLSRLEVALSTRRIAS